MAIAKIADIEATTEEDVVIAATLQNKSDFEAKEVKVGVYKVEDLKYQLVGLLQSVDIAANADAQVEFNLGKLEAGNYTYYVQVTSIDGNETVISRDVTVKVTEPVVAEVNVSLTAIQGVSNIDLAEGAENTITVWAENTGNVDASVKFNLTAGDLAMDGQIIEIKAGRNGYATYSLPTANLNVGDKVKVVATITVEGNAEEAVTTLEREYDVVDSSVATEPVFSITAENVTVPFGAESFEIKAVVKNISEVDAQGLTVKLLKGITEVETKTLDLVLVAGAEETVTFTVKATEEEPFVAGKTATYYVQAPKAQAEVVVTFEEEPVVTVVDLAITQINGSLSLAVEENSLGVWVENIGTADVKDAKVALRYGNAIQEGTVSVKANEGQFCWFTIPATDLQAGEFAVEATVTAEGDIDETNNKLEKTYSIAPVLAFAAEDITVFADDESYLVNVIVTNPSNVEVENVKLVVMNGAEAIAASDPVTIGAGETTVTIKVNSKLEKDCTLTITYNGETVATLKATVSDDPATGIAAIKAQYGQNVQIYTLSGKKVNEVRKGNVYIVNGKKLVVK